MRIAYVCADPGVPVFGGKGASVHLQEILRALIRFGHEVHLFTPSLGGKPDGDLEQVIVHRLPGPNGGSLAERESAALELNDELFRSLTKYRPFDLLYERYSLWSHAGIRFADQSNIASILEVNAPLIEEQANHRGLINREAAERVASYTFSTATVVGAVSSPVASWVAGHCADPGNIHVVANGVDPGRFDKTPAARTEGVFTVGFLGTLKPWHGVETLVEAVSLCASQHGSYRLLIIGDGPTRPHLEEMVERAQIDSVTSFIGAVEPARIPEFLSRFDVAVAPYPALDDFYFSPLKLYEYMAASLPVVASAIGEIEKTIVHNHTGFLCPPGDARALADSLERLRTRPELRHRTGQRARAFVAANCTWDQVAERLLSLAEELFDDAQSPITVA